ncbi:MAG TPA: SDR family NAD(P)-dependent oxidoreductase [Thermomicrobiales bacterium]|nr:SDR family NAD(P)-dependent oxidoreductase [Thermomicrobiales bacterium]
MTDPAPQAFGRLRGKVCLVTGAAAGIGRATADLVAREGARLALFDRDAAALERLAGELTASGAEVVAVAGDVSQDADVRRAVDAAVARFGRLDVLVANAGIIPLSDALETSPEAWDAVMAIDGRGMFLSCKHAIAAMLEGGGGSIVCLSSISGLAGQKRQAAYGPAKFVASGITKHLAIEWADRGIRVNAVAPGTIRTDRVKQLPDEPGGPDYLRVMEQAHPMGRIGEPSEVARAILFLASDEASFVTGAILPVDGGFLAQ